MSSDFKPERGKNLFIQTIISTSVTHGGKNVCSTIDWLYWENKQSSGVAAVTPYQLYSQMTLRKPLHSEKVQVKKEIDAILLVCSDRSIDFTAITSKKVISTDKTGRGRQVK